MADKAQCKGFLCGSNLIEGSVTGDKLDKDSITELIKEIIEEGADDWFKEIIKEIIEGSIDDIWFHDFIKDLLEKLIKEDWFRELICSLDCMVPEVFDVIPTDITFQATGGEASIEIIVGDDKEWELTD